MFRISTFFLSSLTHHVSSYEQIDPSSLRSGSSCHQCKNTKPASKLAFCKNVFQRRSTNEKRVRIVVFFFFFLFSFFPSFHLLSSFICRHSSHSFTFPPSLLLQECRKKYCQSCLQKFYAYNLPDILDNKGKPYVFMLFFLHMYMFLIPRSLLLTLLVVALSLSLSLSPQLVLSFLR